MEVVDSFGANQGISSVAVVNGETTKTVGAGSERNGRISPAPLAFGAFAGTTFLLSIVNTGIVSPVMIFDVLATAWLFGGTIQILVGFWHFRNNELFPAVTFASFGAFWVSFALFGTLYLDKIPPALRGKAVALFLIPWAIFSLYMFIGSLRTNIAIAVAYFLVEATVITLIIGNYSANATIVHLGGWIGIVLALEVWYIAAAEIINHQFMRDILPLGTLG